MIFTAVLTSTIMGYALWLRYADTGGHARIGLVEGYYQKQLPEGPVWDTPHWLTADMTLAKIRDLNTKVDTERAQHAAAKVP